MFKQQPNDVPADHKEADHRRQQDQGTGHDSFVEIAGESILVLSCPGLRKSRQQRRSHADGKHTERQLEQAHGVLQGGDPSVT